MMHFFFRQLCSLCMFSCGKNSNRKRNEVSNQDLEHYCSAQRKVNETIIVINEGKYSTNYKRCFNSSLQHRGVGAMFPKYFFHVPGVRIELTTSGL